MSEKEIRNILRDVCAELDRRVRDAVRQGVRKVLLPTALGAGLAMSPGCDSERNTPSDATAQKDGGSTRFDNGAVPPYMAPDQDGGARSDLGPQPDYMAPGPDGGPVPPYMAPDDGGAKIDTGPVLEYMAPDPDAGPLPPYMAPPPADLGIDGDPNLDYMAPDPS